MISLLNLNKLLGPHHVAFNYWPNFKIPNVSSLKRRRFTPSAPSPPSTSVLRPPLNPDAHIHHAPCACLSLRNIQGHSLLSLALALLKLSQNSKTLCSAHLTQNSLTFFKFLNRASDFAIWDCGLALIHATGLNRIPNL